MPNMYQANVTTDGAPVPASAPIAVSRAWLVAAAAEVQAFALDEFNAGGRPWAGAVLCAHFTDGRRVVCEFNAGAARARAFLRSVPAWRGLTVIPSMHVWDDAAGRVRSLARDSFRV